ncbi:MAG TPA: S8 family serine peptidase, partial [Gammaproteobacteria bacterium]
CFVFRLKHPEQQAALVASLDERSDIESVQALQFFHGKGNAPPGRGARSADITDDSAGNDPLANWNEALNRNLLAAHRSATGKSVTVAIIDTGVDTGHEDLRGAALTAMDFVDGKAVVPPETHGTAIVGLLAARPDNGVGIRGYAPDARILLLRACWETDAPDESASGDAAVCNSFTLAKALSFALASDAGIVSLSISGPRDPLLERLAGKLVQDNRLLVVAGESSAHFPASVDNSIVAAMQPATLHSTGPALTLLPDDRYGLREGTSITTARVAGVAALMKELDPELSAGEFRQRLQPDADVFVDISQVLRGDSASAARLDPPALAPGK